MPAGRFISIWLALCRMKLAQMEPMPLWRVATHINWQRYEDTWILALAFTAGCVVVAHSKMLDIEQSGLFHALFVRIAEFAPTGQVRWLYPQD